MTEEQFEIQRLKKANRKLYKTIENLKVDCYKCTCGIVSECNCFHLGLLPKRLTNLSTYDKVEALLKDLEF